MVVSPLFELLFSSQTILQQKGALPTNSSYPRNQHNASVYAKYLWTFLSIHHCSKEIDWLSTEQNHPVNFLIIVAVNLVSLIAVFDFLYIATLSVLIRRSYGFFFTAALRSVEGP
jgi:hypothetical protein